MKYRNQFFKFKCHFNAPEGEPAGGGGEGGNDNSQNNNDGGLPDHATLWDNESSPAAADVAPVIVQAAAQPLSAAESFSNHVSGIDFGTDNVAMMEALRNGDAEAFGEQIKAMQVGIYKAAMLDANKMMRQTTDGLKADMQKSTATTISSDKLISQMNEKLPFTAMPAYAPMAKAVLTRLLSKEGMTQDRAIKETGDYFSGMAETISGNVQGGPSGNRSRSSGNQFGNDAAQSGDMDWIEFMGGKPE